MITTFDKPLIGIVTCQMTIRGHPVESVHNKYMDAIILAGGVPLLLPHGLMNSADLLEHAMAPLSGIMLTGSNSNIEPYHYGGTGIETCADPTRDRLAFALIHALIKRNMPLIAICRGLQELVVATGGTLHRALHTVEGLSDHRENRTLPLAEQYAAAHEVTIEPGGLLSQLLPNHKKLQVNSLHSQGIRTTGPALRPEARAADGVIEAVSLPDHPFALGVQWHPEWQSYNDAISHTLFTQFIKACDCYQKRGIT